MTEAEVIEKVKHILQNQDVEDVTMIDGEIKRFLSDSLFHHSKISPRKYVVDTIGDAGYDYDVPAGFDVNFSSIESIEYPQGERVPVYLDASDYVLYRAPDDDFQIRFLGHTPLATQTFRTTFTSPWLLADIDDVPDGDMRTICYYIAHLVCLSLESKYSNVEQSSIEADQVDYSDLAERYGGLAKEFKEKYESVFSLQDGIQGFSVVVDYDTPSGIGGKFTHDETMF